MAHLRSSHRGLPRFPAPLAPGKSAAAPRATQEVSAAQQEAAPGNKMRKSAHLCGLGIFRMRIHEFNLGILSGIFSSGQAGGPVGCRGENSGYATSI